MIWRIGGSTLIWHSNPLAKVTLDLGIVTSRSKCFLTGRRTMTRLQSSSCRVSSTGRWTASWCVVLTTWASGLRRKNNLSFLLEKIAYTWMDTEAKIEDCELGTERGNKFGDFDWLRGTFLGCGTVKLRGGKASRFIHSFIIHRLIAMSTPCLHLSTAPFRQSRV